VLGEQEQVRVGWFGWECWDLDDDVNTLLEAIEGREQKTENNV